MKSEKPGQSGPGYFLAAAQERLAGLSPEADLVLAEWARVLDRLESDPLSLHDTLDWAAKRALLVDLLNQTRPLRKRIAPGDLRRS